MKKFLVSLALIASALLTGCATTPMPYSKDGETVDLKNNAVVLFTITQKNEYRKGFQPKVDYLYGAVEGSKESKDRFTLAPDDKSEFVTNTVEKGNKYLMRVMLKPGTYFLSHALSHARFFPITTTYWLPIASPFKVEGPGVIYLGNISGNIRERKEGEFRAGGVLPLIDQAIGGASGGTYDITIADEWEKDQVDFLQRFPQLKDIEVKKVILPPFNRTEFDKNS